MEVRDYLQNVLLNLGFREVLALKLVNGTTQLLGCLQLISTFPDLSEGRMGEKHLGRLAIGWVENKTL